MDNDDLSSNDVKSKAMVPWPAPMEAVRGTTSRTRVACYPSGVVCLSYMLVPIDMLLKMPTAALHANTTRTGGGGGADGGGGGVSSIPFDRLESRLGPGLIRSTDSVEALLIMDIRCAKGLEVLPSTLQNSGLKFETHINCCHTTRGQFVSSLNFQPFDIDEPTSPLHVPCAQG